MRCAELGYFARNKKKRHNLYATEEPNRGVRKTNKAKLFKSLMNVLLGENQIKRCRNFGGNESQLKKPNKVGTVTKGFLKAIAVGESNTLLSDVLGDCTGTDVVTVSSASLFS